MTCGRVDELAPGFVLGALEPEEMDAVREHLAGCLNPHPELADLGGVLPYLALAPEPAEPPAWLRDSVIAAVRADMAANRRPVRTLEPVAVDSAASRSPETEAPGMEPSALPVVSIVPLARARRTRRRIAAIWLGRIAAAVAVVALAGYAVVVQADLNKAKEDQQHARTVLNVIGQPGARTAVLTDEQGTGAGGTVALLPSGHIVVYLNHLPQTHANEIYTVWVTGDNGSRVKVGSFYPEDDGTGFLEVDNVPTSASLWISVNREPNTSVSKPTGPEVLSGTLSI
jgi:hypothetical protein